MEYWEIEEQKKLQNDFCSALEENPPNYEKAKALLESGVDINATDQYGESFLGDFLCLLSMYPRDCDSCQDDFCRTCERMTKPHLFPTVEFIIENGLDTKAHGLDIIASLVHSTHDMQMFSAVKSLLKCPLSDDKEEYERTLEAIGTEESYQRCCCECHEQENLYYAMVEMVDAKMKGLPFEGIHPFYKAIGKKIDRIIYFADKTDFVKTERGTEFNCDFGFVCGDDVLIVHSSINILFMDDRLFVLPQIDITDAFGDDIVGSKIIDILFEHREIVRGNTVYGQPIIIIRLDNGREIRFTHNFGEDPDSESVSRFLTTDDVIKTSNNIDYLVEMCSNTDIDLDSIESFIVGNKMSGDEVTRAAINLVKKYEYEVDTFASRNGRAPYDKELVTTNWIQLFRLFLVHGLNPNRVYIDEDRNCENLLYHLWFLDNMDVYYKLFRVLFQNGADPNVLVDDESIFDKVDENVVLYATLLEIEDEDRRAYERDFRLWLLMIAYGAERGDKEWILDIKDGYDRDMFINCEAFSYKLERTNGDWFLHIYITKTGEEVAVL